MDETTQDIRARIQKIVQHPMRVPVGVGVLAFGTGVGLGYILGMRRRTSVIIVEEDEQDNNGQLTFDFDANKLNEIIEDIKEENNGEASPEDFEVTFVQEEGYEGPDEVPAAISDAARAFVEGKLREELEEVEEDGTPEEAVVGTVSQNVFVNGEPIDVGEGWDYEEERQRRNPTQPYVIHADEFHSDEMGYSQITLTYYAGDNILVDENDVPIYNYEQVIGELKFGHGSEDENVFHVRNDKRRAEYEIIQHEGLFSVEVLGLEIENNARASARELKHSNHRQKFRME